MLPSEDMVGVPLNLNPNPFPRQFSFIMPVGQEAKEGVTMLASVIDRGSHEETRIAAT